MQKDSVYLAGGEPDGAVAPLPNGYVPDVRERFLRWAHQFSIHGHQPDAWEAWLAALSRPGAAIPEGLIDRVIAARQRIKNGDAPMRIPADPTDVDLVLCEVLMYLHGTYERPFWLGDQSGIKPDSPPAK